MWVILRHYLRQTNENNKIIRDEELKWIKITNGGTHGPIFAQNILLIYIYDMVEKVDRYTGLLADNAKVMRKSKTAIGSKRPINFISGAKNGI